MPTKKIVGIMLVMFAFLFSYMAPARADEDEVDKKASGELSLGVFADGHAIGGTLFMGGAVYEEGIVELVLGLRAEVSQLELKAEGRPGGDIKGAMFGFFPTFMTRLNVLKWLSLAGEFGVGFNYVYTPESFWRQDSGSGWVAMLAGGGSYNAALSWGVSLDFKIRGRFSIGPAYAGSVGFQQLKGWNGDAVLLKGNEVHHHFVVNGTLYF